MVTPGRFAIWNGCRDTAQPSWAIACSDHAAAKAAITLVTSCWSTKEARLGAGFTATLESILEFMDLLEFMDRERMHWPMRSPVDSKGDPDG